MPSEDLSSKTLNGELINPQYNPSGKPSPIGDQDFTQGTNDIGIPAKVKLGNYLAQKTTEAHNQYPVAAPLQTFQSAPSSKRGTFLPLAESNGQSAFATQQKFGDVLKSYGLGVHKGNFSGEGRSSFFEPDQISKVLVKVGDLGAQPGDELLANVPSVSPESTKTGNPYSPRPDGDTKSIMMLQYVHDQLVVGNMYSPEKDPAKGALPFLKNQDSSNEEEATRGLFTIQRDLGTFDKNGKNIKVSDMSAMAFSLLLKSTKDDINSGKIFSTKDLTQMIARDFLLRPELAKPNGVSVLDLRLSSIMESASGQKDILSAAIISNGSLVNAGTLPDNGNISSLPALQSSARNSVTRQQLNSFLEPFDETFSTGMLGLAAAGVLSAIVAALLLSAIVEGLSALFGGGGVTSLQSANPSSLRYGKRVSSAAFGGNSKLTDVLADLLRAADTDNAYVKCVPAGLALLFGFPNVDPTEFTNALKGGISSLIDIALNLILSPGYYANFLRTIVSDNAEIASSFKNISFSSGAGAGLAGVFKAIRTIVDSRIYKFLMISAALGDVSLKSLHGTRDVGEDGRMLTKKQQSTLDPDKLTIQNTNDLSSGGGAKLGMYRMQVSRWGADAGSIPSLSLKTFIAAQKKPSSVGVDAESFETRMRFLKPSRENVQFVEDAIEAEYIPFYVHDLRTHEIISMPAFITDFGETFNANYNQVKGIGRQDPVRLYQDTERGVTLGFILAAFTDDDHDHMWFTINKFISMCYPQYSSGRLRQFVDGDATTTFVQPFSQVQAASPMIRLRIGDVFKSNYSKFGLARLFGANSTILSEPADASNQKYKKDIKEAEEKLDEARINARKKILERNSLVSAGWSKGDWVKLKEKTILKKVLPSSNYLPIPGNDGKDGFVIYDSSKQFVEIIDVVYDGTNHSINEQIYYVQFVNDLYGNDVWSFKRNNDGVSPIVGSVESKLKQQIENDPEVISAQQRYDQIAQNSFPNASFLESKNNAIVKSFESTRGRGVAGFITNLSLGYEQNYPWDTRLGKRAPMVVKITMGFVPITDLPLGLDYEGNMRNPSHPVGKIAGSFGDVYGDVSDLKSRNSGRIASHGFNKVWGGESMGTPTENVSITNRYDDAVKNRKKILDPGSSGSDLLNGL